MSKRPIIIDTDPGIDDAIALAIALYSDRLDVKLITTVVGNVNLDYVTTNALKLLTFWNQSIPVAKGAAEPLVRPAVDAASIHGETGMGGYDFPEPDKSLLLDGHAIHHMADIIKNSPEKITLVPIGPLTNIALLFKIYPEVKENVEEIVLMGGSTGRGNSGVLSEFNIHVDPEAAKIVFSSGVPIVMVGLDVGEKALVFPEDSSKIKTFNRNGEMIYSILKHYRSYGIQNGLRMYDACAIAYLLHPEMFTTVETYVDIELNGTYSSGATIVDLNGLLQREHNAKVCIDINQEIFKDWFLNALKECE